MHSLHVLRMTERSCVWLFKLLVYEILVSEKTGCHESYHVQVCLICCACVDSQIWKSSQMFSTFGHMGQLILCLWLSGMSVWRNSMSGRVLVKVEN